MQVSDISVMEGYAQDAMAAIATILRAKRTLIIAFSSGKDSTATLVLALNAARRVREEGGEFPPILVTHGDTGIENPLVSALARHEMAKAEVYGRKHGFVVVTEIARPLLNDTWAVAVLSGRKLPTFVNASSRDCTIMFKVDPMTRLRNRLLSAPAHQGAGGPPVTLVGTRFEESTGRATRMSERGETAYTPWEKAGAWYMSPIANWSSDDVWEFLGTLRNGPDLAYTDARAIFDMYASAADTTCAVVADMATENAKKSRACGARFGCVLCAAVGRDKSLENMLKQPQYAWMANLNRIQRFLVDTQYDWNRRTWLGRTIDDDGFIKIQPDTYSPAMLADLLRYCLTADLEEARASYRLGIAPRFQLVPPEAVIAIDAFWSLHGIQEKPFTAIKIWHDIHVGRQRYYAPEVKPVPYSSQPKARYLHVGASWDGDTPERYTGLRDVLQEGFGGKGCIGSNTLKDGRVVMHVPTAQHFSIDPEAVELFFEFEVDYVLRQHEATHSVCTEGIFHYLRLGMLSTANKHVSGDLDRIARRTAWKQRQGLTGSLPPEVLIRLSQSTRLPPLKGIRPGKSPVFASFAQYAQ